MIDDEECAVKPSRVSIISSFANAALALRMHAPLCIFYAPCWRCLWSTADWLPERIKVALLVFRG